MTVKIVLRPADLEDNSSEEFIHPLINQLKIIISSTNKFYVKLVSNSNQLIKSVFIGQKIYSQSGFKIEVFIPYDPIFLISPNRIDNEYNDVDIILKSRITNAVTRRINEYHKHLLQEIQHYTDATITSEYIVNDALKKLRALLDTNFPNDQEYVTTIMNKLIPCEILDRSTGE
ncbi:hypothetical protein GJ496_008472 [Pomphorhynchus laevis]|nr:hypothetical protein GJ496_008472 [Pomphorhynchus laevis]